MNKKVDVKSYICRGLDIGTMNIIASRRDEEGNIKVRRIRDAFVSLEMEQKKLLQMGQLNHFVTDSGVIVIGDDAIRVSSAFSVGGSRIDLRRPLSKGTLNPKETDAQDVVSEMISQVLEKTDNKDNLVYFSIPATPLDLTEDELDLDTIKFHEKAIREIISKLGWNPFSANEGEALVYAECQDTNYSGFGMSFGAGMVNAALVYKGLPLVRMSVARGGDYIDKAVSKRTRLSQSQACLRKEKGIDLFKPNNREEQAIAFYYEFLIEYALTYFLDEIKKSNATETIDYLEGIPAILGGGTALATNFDTLFKRVIAKLGNFPFSVTDIRLATDRLNSVAKGLLVRAENHE